MGLADGHPLLRQRARPAWRPPRPGRGGLLLLALAAWLGAAALRRAAAPPWTAVRAGASAPPRADGLLVCVAAAYDPARVRYLVGTLRRLFDTYEVPRLDVVVDTTSPALRRALPSDLRRRENLEFVVHPHGSMRHGWYLAWAHRRRVASRARDYGAFMYLEDDMDLPWANYQRRARFALGAGACEHVFVPGMCVCVCACACVCVCVSVHAPAGPARWARGARHLAAGRARSQRSGGPPPPGRACMGQAAWARLPAPPPHSCASHHRGMSRAHPTPGAAPLSPPQTRTRTSPPLQVP
jgi:hypothetical protein